MVVEQQKRYLPYVGAAGWLTTLHQLMVRSMPQKIDVDWLTAPDRFTFSAANASQLLAMIQKLGWINSDGTILEEGRKLRLSGEAWNRALRETVERIYPDLLKQIERADKFGVDELEHFFIAATDIGKSGRSQMMAVFRWFIHEAGMNEIEEKVWGTARKSPRTASAPRRQPQGTGNVPSRQKVMPSQEASGKRKSRSSGQDDRADQRLSAISSILKINIDASWDETRMETVFRLLERLLSGDPDG